MISINLKKQLGCLDLDFGFSSPVRGITVLHGPSGAGKTSILNMLAGLLRPDSGFFQLGERTLFDADARIDLPPKKRRIGYIFQEKRLFPFLSVKRNLLFGSPGRKTRRKPDFDATVELLGISHLLKRECHSLSGGEGQRVAIGRALFSEPDLLLMDEPLSSLDDERKNELLPYIESLPSHFAIPVILVTHSPAEIERLADHVIFIRDGKSMPLPGLNGLADHHPAAVPFRRHPNDRRAHEA